MSRQRYVNRLRTSGRAGKTAELKISGTNEGYTLMPNGMERSDFLFARDEYITYQREQGMSLEEIGKRVGMTHQAVHYAVERHAKALKNIASRIMGFKRVLIQMSRLTSDFRPNKKKQTPMATCVKCGRWKPYNELIWPIDPKNRKKLICKKCSAKAEAKKRKISDKYLDTRTGLRKRQRCDTCKQLKPPRSFHLFQGTLMIRNTCIACEREINRLNRSMRKCR